MTINVEKQKLWHFGLGFTDFVYICNVFAKQLYADLVCVYEKSAQILKVGANTTLTIIYKYNS